MNLKNTSPIDPIFHGKQFHQIIDLPDGKITPGTTDHRPDIDFFGMTPTLINGKRVLDIAANDGFWAFWAERNGASDVVAIDIDSYSKYDWGWEGAPDALLANQESKDSNFNFLKERYGFKSRRLKLSVYDLTPDNNGIFDIVYFYGLLYHLRHPLLAFDKIRGICNGVVFVETHTAGIDHMLPSNIFYFSDSFGITNWCGPSVGCIAAWMKDSGFKFVYRERCRKSALRTRMVGCINEELAEHFMNNPGLIVCDHDYFNNMKEKIAEYHSRCIKNTM